MFVQIQKKRVAKQVKCAWTVWLNKALFDKLLQPCSEGCMIEFIMYIVSQDIVSGSYDARIAISWH
jgi:hypothetical protein